MGTKFFIKDCFFVAIVIVVLGADCDTYGMHVQLGRARAQERLLCAIAIDHADGVRAALVEGANSNGVDMNEDTPLYKAVCADQEHIVQILLEANADINALNNSNNTALHGAIRAGHDTIAKMLIKNGAHMNGTNMYGYAPLHYAVKNSCLEIAMILVGAGADLHGINGDGQTVFDLATADVLQTMIHMRSAKAKGKKIMRDGVKRGVIDVPIMVTLAAGSRDRELVSWLLELDPRADSDEGICSMCTQSFVERVVEEDIVFRRTRSQLEQFNQLRAQFKEKIVACGLSRILKETDILLQFLWEKGIVALVSEYAAV